MAETEGRFRCPFEIQALKEGRMLRVKLSDNRTERMKQLQDGFSAFHKDKAQLGLSFILPEKLLARCTSNVDLKHEILPYQAEAVAADLDFRLQPFWPYQLARFQKDAIQKRLLLQLGNDHINIQIVLRLCEMMKEKGQYPRSITDIANWLNSEHLLAREAVGGLDSMIRVSLTDTSGKKHPILHITPHTAIFETDRDEPDNPKKNRNCFGIVRSPFYPKSFGRYSSDIEMVYTREADFTHLPDAVRRKISRDSNIVLRSEGIAIGDLDLDKQGGGVWAHEIEPSYSESPNDGFLLPKD